MQNIDTVAIIVAGGKGKRMRRPKQFLMLAGRPMLEWTLAAFQKTKVIDGIILVAAKAQMKAAEKFRFSKILKVVAAGKERQDSVKNGLSALPPSTKIVAIHDGARPAVTVDIIERSIREARKFGAVAAGVPVKDTMKVVSRKSLVVSRTVDRANLWQAQTPQVFKAEIIKKAYSKLKAPVTDDAMAVEKLGLPVKMVMGSDENIKVTTPEDLKIMEAILNGNNN